MRGRIFLCVKAIAWQAAVWLLSGIVLFLPAGTLSWLAGWIFFAVFFGFVLFLSAWLLFRAPDLLEERLTILKSDQLSQDKVWLIAFYTLSLFWLALMPLDAMQLHWSRMPSWVQAVGLLLLLSALVGIFVTTRQNRYLSPTVRVQQDRGHALVDTGVYRHVRHPLYASACLFYLGVPLLLGSWSGFGLAPVFISLLALRSSMEEDLLRENLPGYRSYMGKVLFRFIPGIW